MKKLIFYPFYAYAMKIYHKDKDYERANKFYQIAERFYPNHTENLFKIGMCYKKCRNYRKASEYFEKALELDSENKKYKEQLQIARVRDFILFAPTKLWWQEIIALEQEIKDKGEKYELLLNLAEDCLAMKHYDKAAKAYRRAIALCKEKDRLPQLYYEMGYAYENVADEVHLRLAKEAYAQAINLDKELESKRYGIGVFHCAKERWRFANRAFLEKVESLPLRHCERSKAIHNQAESGFHNEIAKDNDETQDNGLPQPLTRLRNDAVADVSDSRHCEDDRTKQSITLHTCDSAIASLRGMSGANDEAIHNVDNRKTLNGEIKDYRLPRDSNESLAMTENPSLRNDKVVSPQESDIIDCHADKSARNDTIGSVDCYKVNASHNDERGDSTSYNDESQPVIASVSEAIHNPAYPKVSDDLLLNKVGESFERLYDWENALKYYQQSLELNYQNPQTHFRLGFVYERIENYQQAAESYTQGLQRNNDLNTYWVYRLGFCLNQLGEFQEASKILLNLRTTDAYPLIVGGGGDLYDQCFEE